MARHVGRSRDAGCLENVAAVRARGVVLDLAPDASDREPVWTVVSSGFGITFAAETACAFTTLLAPRADLPHFETLCGSR